MKVGVVGCGMVSGYGHLPTIQSSPEWKLAGIADTDPVRLEEVRKQYNVEIAAGDYRELLDIPGLDALVVATHLNTHSEIAISALEKGIHVLCEKPMAASVAECKAMADAARQSGRFWPSTSTPDAAPYTEE